MQHGEQSRPACDVGDLSDDLLCRIFSELDSAELRLAVGVCRRWASLLRSRLELWRRVEVALPPKRSRGRDRRNSYTTPCALNVARLAAWLLHRRQAITTLEVALLYPDALALLPQLLPPLGALRRLALRGHCSDWPYLWADWRWLQGVTALESLDLHNALPDMAELLVPPSLTELRISRVGQGDADTEGFDQLPDCFSLLTRLQRLTLGTAVPYLLQEDEEAALAPLRAARHTLRELRLVNGALTAVPEVVASFTALELLSFRGCDRLEAFGELCQHKSDPFEPLRHLAALRCLDFGQCALDAVPPWLGGLRQLRTLLLPANQLTELPNTWGEAAEVGPPAPGAAGGSGSRRAATAGAAPPAPALPPNLQHLDVSGNKFGALPEALLAPGASQLTHLDLSSCHAMHAAPADWRRLLGRLPRLRLLRHGCRMLAAEERGHGGAARLAAAVGGCPQLQLELVLWRPPIASMAALVAAKQQVQNAAHDGLPQHARELLQDLLAEVALQHGPGAPGSSAAGTAAAGAGGSLERPPSRHAHSCGSLDELEQGAAAALLGSGPGGGSKPSSSGGGGTVAAGSWLGDSEGGGGGAHATLADLAATASSPMCREPPGLGG